MSNPIEDILTEQIAGLRATASMYEQQRAEALAAAEAATIHAGGADARADELQAALDTYRELVQFEIQPEPPALLDGIPVVSDEPPQISQTAGDPLIYRELREQLGD